MTRHPLRVWLEQTGVLQRELARQAGTQQSRIAQFLGGTCGLGPALAARVVAATEELGRTVHPPPLRLHLEDLLLHRPPNRRKPRRQN
jgi:hypothetical protein